jgi:hypothetical protein
MHRITSTSTSIRSSLRTHSTGTGTGTYLLPSITSQSLCIPQHHNNNTLSSPSPSLYTIPSRSIRASPVGGHDYVQHAADHGESKRLVLHLYKKILRSLPILLQQFEFLGDGTLRVARHNIRQQFNAYTDLTDLPVIDLLRHKCEIEWEESMLMHKTKSHFGYTVFGDPMLSAHLRTPHVCIDSIYSIASHPISSCPVALDFDHLSVCNEFVVYCSAFVKATTLAGFQCC